LAACRAPTGGRLVGVKKTSLYIEPELDAALARLAEAEGVSKAEVIRRALREAANGAPAPRIVGVGVMKGLPSDLASNVDHYLAQGFGRD
jgi:Ribbon-helix-helix protein, copG family